MSNSEKITDSREINQLISLGKEKGYLTYEEVNDVLPSDVVAPKQIDDLMHLFGENEIDIVDTALKGEKVVLSRIEDREEKEGNNNEEEIADSKTDNVSIDDPVRMYLREMGTISLLTREGEVEIAKRIEEGQYEVIAAVANCAVTVNEILNIGEQLKKKHISVFDIIEVNEPEEKKEKSESHERKKVLKHIQSLKIQKKKLDNLRIRLEKITLSEKVRTKVSNEESKQKKMLEKY